MITVIETRLAKKLTPTQGGEINANVRNHESIKQQTIFNYRSSRCDDIQQLQNTWVQPKALKNTGFIIR